MERRIVATVEPWVLHWAAFTRSNRTHPLSDRIQQEQMILQYIRNNGQIKRKDVMDLCRLSRDRASRLLFISGYGDAEDCPDLPLTLKPHAAEQAATFLAAHAATQQRFDRVLELIKGFETSFGMELLATVHWVATREHATTVESAITKVHNWNNRKRMFEPRHIDLAWQQLHASQWLDTRPVKLD
jgi:hypothetical protein